jgi:hypothetical protein
MQLKKCWITPCSRASFSLSFESTGTEVINRIYVKENVFPDKPTPEHPLRHTINFGQFDDNDLLNIADTIYDFLSER